MKCETKFVRAGQIYKAKSGCIHNPDKPQYNCYKPAYTGTYVLVDCDVCDEYGNADPEIGGSIPIFIDAIGKKLTRTDLA
jgi:hypothetical protein